MGCESKPIPRNSQPQRFNPRTRVGCEFALLAPSHRRIGFQSTHPCGVRKMLYQMHLAFQQFQSTHPCGVRKPLSADSSKVVLFQSTHPCGVRKANICIKILVILFQSTHPCGVRTPAEFFVVSPTKFQSTHPCGVRMAMQVYDRLRFVSIHAPVWGANNKKPT